MPTTTEPSPRFRWLLGDTPQQRLRLSQQLLATSLMFGSALVLAYAALAVEQPPGWILLWSLFSLGSLIGVYVLIRTGWSERLEDPAMTEVQIVLALISCNAAYLLAGPLRALTLPIGVLVLVFGMFQLRSGRNRWMGSVAFALLLVAIGLGQALGLGYALRDEVGHLMMALIVIPGVTILAARMSGIRRRLSAQRHALNEAVVRIEQLATRDELTGLFNRRHGDEVLRNALRRHQRSGRPLCVVLLDIDHFKRFNDVHGHAVGDRVLRSFAQAALSSLRATDTLARWGGEEFLLLLDDSDLAAAQQAMGRLRDAVARAAVEAQGQTLGFSFSAGLTLVRDGEAAELALERADQALYRAKAEGRDRYVLG
jgi:diguanylate cyclase